MVFQKQRIHNFQGTDHEYIAYLESLVLQATANHSPSRSPPSPPCSEVYDEDDPNESLMFIQYQPQIDKQESRKTKRAEPRLEDRRLEGQINKQDTCVVQSRKRKKAGNKKDTYVVQSRKKKQAKQRLEDRRWQGQMDEMFSEMTAVDWSSRRRTLGLSSQAGILAALDFVIRGTVAQPDLTASEADLSTTLYDSSSPVLLLLDSFATTTVVLETQSMFTTQMSSFRVLVFVSLCCVALENGANQECVNDIMRKCISDSSEKNLSRLRNGALWVNRMMVELTKNGFDYLAYEVFVLWGRTIAQYGRFADAGHDAFCYFQQNIPKYKPCLEIQASLPFWVPFIVKTIVGEIFSLSNICTVLGYDSDPRISVYPRYSDNYCSRQIPVPRSISPEATAPLTDQSRSNFVSISNRHGRAKEVTGLTSDSTQIQVLLEAAQQSDCLPQTVPDINEWGRMSFFNDGWVDIFPDGMDELLVSPPSCTGP